MGTKKSDAPRLGNQGTGNCEEKFNCGGSSSHYPGCAARCSGQSRVPAELQALRASFLEFPTGRPADLVNPAGVGALGGSEVDAGAIVSRGERLHSEVSGLHRLGDVVSPDLTPAQQVLRRDQEAAVGSGSATGSATQTVELLGHGQRIMARWVSGARGGL